MTESDRERGGRGGRRERGRERGKKRGREGGRGEGEREIERRGRAAKTLYFTEFVILKNLYVSSFHVSI